MTSTVIRLPPPTNQYQHLSGLRTQLKVCLPTPHHPTPHHPHLTIHTSSPHTSLPTPHHPHLTTPHLTTHTSPPHTSPPTHHHPHLTTPHLTTHTSPPTPHHPHLTTPHLTTHTIVASLHAISRACSAVALSVCLLSWHWQWSVSSVQIRWNVECERNDCGLWRWWGGVCDVSTGAVCLRPSV